MEQTNLRYRTINLERTMEDVTFFTEDIPLVTVDKINVEDLIKLLRRSIQQTPEQVHRMVLVFKDQWIEVVYGFFAGKHFLPNVTKNVYPIPTGYKIVVEK